MLKRAQRLAAQQKRAASDKPCPKPVSSKDFSLRDSPLTRVLAWGVGRGQSASGMQRVSAAAVAESGVANVHKSGLLAHYSFPKAGVVGCICSQGLCWEILGTAWASSMGSGGRRESHIEESLHRAAKSSDAPCINAVTCMLSAFLLSHT